MDRPQLVVLVSLLLGLRVLQTPLILRQQPNG
jgi:hypothetical protein